MILWAAGMVFLIGAMAAVNVALAAAVRASDAVADRLDHTPAWWDQEATR